MNHALCAVQINLVNADYTAGPGEVTQLSVASPALATTASLNVQTGQLSVFAGQGDAITVDKTITLTGESQGTKIIAIPTDAQDNLTVKVVVDGATSTVPVTLNQPFVQGKAYVVNLKVKDAKTPVELVSVSVKEWTEEQLGDFDAMPVLPDDKYSIEVTIPSNSESFQSNVYGFTGTIDWGDGTKTSHSNENYPSHTYTNAGKYNVTHRGKCPILGMYVPETGPDDSTEPVPFPYITDIIYIGKDLGITKMDCAFLGSGISKLKERIFYNLTNVTSFFGTFADCKELTNIPSGLFDNSTQATNFWITFSGCSALTVIPNGLFDHCTNATTFNRTFAGCTALTTIPQALFNNCTNVTTFERTFESCSSLLNVPRIFDGCTNVTTFERTFAICDALTTIAEGLFNGCSKVTRFNSTFEWCNSLTDVPRIFDGCTNVTSFFRTFMYCRKLTTIAEGLFNNCTNVTTFEETFSQCYSLINLPRIFDGCTNVTTFKDTFADCKIEIIPDKFFDGCPNVTTFEKTFTFCKSLTTIPVGLFDNCKEVTNFNHTFYYCNIHGETPYTIINGKKVHLYERKDYPEDFTTPVIFDGCFLYSGLLIDYTQIPSDWK